ncbi:MAG: DMT family transporter [Rhodobiaceae bacterium]|jgi:drug/metabolite transporter (DMT)-like permease
MRLSIFEQPQGDRPMLALALLLVGVSILSLQDSLVKLVAPQTSFWQVQIIRSFFNLVMLAGLAMFTGGIGLLWPRRLRPAILRGVLLALCMGFFFGAAQQITVTQMATGLYTYPLFVTLLAGPVLGERIGRWRIGALLLGAAGCLLVLNPFADAFTPLQAVPVLAGFFYACNILVLRRYCRNESPLALACMVNLLFIVTGMVGAVAASWLPVDPAWRAAMPFILVGWPEITTILLGFLAILAVLNLFGNLFLSRAYQTADSSLLAPLDFTYLLLIAIWGRVLFDSWPTPLAILGMVMIAAAGMITAMRERRRPDAMPLPSQSG